MFAELDAQLNDVTEIVINEDKTVEAVWKGKKGRGSLFQVMATGNCETVNQLDGDELLAAMLGAKFVPFPSGEGEQVYKKLLATVKNEPERLWEGGKPKMDLGDLRKGCVVRAGDGCNAPTDTYLSIAKDCK